MPDNVSKRSCLFRFAGSVGCTNIKINKPAVKSEQYNDGIGELHNLVGSKAIIRSKQLALISSLKVLIHKKTIDYS
ncbi:hypothetical protein SLEP1_g41385 [Rubroshorea leprosula]|uniref:Uncharacterized protein n=1 Tax=Rubroshorea leprosula TaxID=152421 RepID=A0AAV5L6G1_9ROSI|nr:hypothetical protein SLEP1_g41385 [Rubroshorea leprosula]